MRFGLRVCAIGLAGALASSARAEMPAGEYTIPVGGENGLAFPSGDILDLCETVGVEQLCISSSVETDADGHVSGAALLELDDGEISAEIELVLDGAVGGSIAKPKATLDFTADGTTTNGSLTLDLVGGGRLKCKLDSEDPSQLFCKGRAKLCAYFLGERIDCAGLPFATVLAFERTPFDIQLDLVTGDRNVVNGDAAVAIDALPVYDYLARGKYKPMADTTTLKLTSTDPALKTKIAVKKAVLEAGGASSGTLVFKVAGQTGKVEITP